MKKLSKKDFLYLSFMVFGMFFGAGNLIFPPFMGKLAGSNSIKALIFFGISAVVFPMLGVVVGTYTGGMDYMLNKIDKYIAKLYPLAIYLTLIPLLAIPRAGSMPFVIGIQPYVASKYIIGLRLIFTSIFFIIVYLLCINPNKLMDRLGKILTPILIFLIIFIFIGVILKVDKKLLIPDGTYLTSPTSNGFLDGYNTMDSLGGLMVGVILSKNLLAKGIEEEILKRKYAIKICTLAGITIFTMYSMLTYIGATTSHIFPYTKTGAEVLTLVCNYIFGKFGVLVLTSVFTVACISVSIALMTMICDFFSENYSFISYKKWLIIWVLISFIFSNFGLEFILKISIPILLSLYPLTLSLIVMPILRPLHKDSRFVYSTTIYTILFFSIISALNILKFNLGIITKLVSILPLGNEGLPWLIPGILVLLLSSIIIRIKKIN